jgi:O-antigen ligase
VGDVPILDRFFGGDVSTLNGRTYLWQAVLSHFDPALLLGNGLQASNALLVQLQSPIYGHGVIGTASHELFLETLYDSGIIGLILFICVFISLAASLIGKMRKAGDDHRMVFAMALAAFVSVFVQSLESNDFWVQAVGIYAWIVMALPFALCWSAPQQAPDVHEAVLDEIAEPRISAISQTEYEQISKV